MDKNINGLRLVFGILLAVLYDALLIIIGSLIPESIVGYCLCFFSFAITFYFIVKNTIVLIKRNKNKYQFNFEDKIKEMKKYQKDINDFEKVYLKVKKVISKFNNYFIFLLILQSLIIIFGVKSFVIGKIFMAISIFINLDLVTSLVNKDEINKALTKDESNNYPYIKSIVNKCKSKFDIKDDISVIFYPGYNISVGKVGKKTFLTVGALALMVLSEEELENILYHEMAHIYNKDTALSDEIIKKSYLVRNIKLITLSLGINLLLFNPIVADTDSEIEMFLYFVKLNRETIADDVILEKGHRQVFINALAKTMIEQYQDEYRCYMNVYEFEKPMTNYLDYCLQVHRQNYFENKEMYNHFLKNTLIRQFDTHPSLKMRMDKMGVTDFVIDFDLLKNAELEKEIKQIKDNLNKEWFKNASQFWNHGREQYYLIYVREYDKVKDKPFDELTLEDKIKYAYCNIMLNNKDIALDCFDKILEENPDNSFSLINRGFIKYGKNDISCVNDFKKAKSLDMSIAEQMNFYIGTFYNNNGYEDLIEEYRKDSIIDANKNIKSAKFLEEQKYKVYQEHDLPKEVIDTIKVKISTFGCIKEAYLMKKLVSEENHIYLLCVSYDYNKIDNEEVSKVNDDIFLILSSIDNYNITLDEITYSKKIQNVIKEKKIENLIDK